MRAQCRVRNSGKPFEAERLTSGKTNQTDSEKPVGGIMNKKGEKLEVQVKLRPTLPQWISSKSFWSTVENNRVAAPVAGRGFAPVQNEI